jgi:hypothetical protein
VIPDRAHEERLSPRQSHGTKALKRAVLTLGRRTVDRRTQVGKALATWRTELLEDLGGAANISTQEAALVDAAVKTKLILDSVDAWLLNQPSLVSKRNRSVLPAVRDRNALVAMLRGLLGDLGLRRRAREDASLADILGEYASGEDRRSVSNAQTMLPARAKPLPSQGKDLSLSFPGEANKSPPLCESREGCETTIAPGRPEGGDA